MISAFHEIIEYKEDDWQEFLERVMLIDVFLPVIKYYQDVNTLKCVIRYIVYAYSVNSDKITLGLDWQKNKQQIFEFVMVKPEKTLYEDLIHLKSDAVLQSVNNWMEVQDSDTFKQLMILKDLRVEMQLSANSKIIKSSGECDYDQKMKNAEYATKLKGMIKELESELLQNNHKMKEAAKEVRLQKPKMTVGPETFSK